MRANQLICALLFLFVLTACGQKGDLYLENGVQEGSPTEETTESTRQRENTEREQADK